MVATPYRAAFWPIAIGIIFFGALLIPDQRFLVLGIWGLGGVLVWGRVARRRYRRWKRFGDVRSYRDFVGGLALFICAGASAFAIAVVLFGTPGIGVRPFAVALALGSFMTAGFIFDDDEPDVR